MKVSRYNLIVAGLIISGSILITPKATAVEGLSANVGVTSNYIWRGLEQTNGDAAVSGGIDYVSESGFHFGTWASNASWVPGMTYEFDIYGGYTGKFDNFSYDIGYFYYAYPDSDVDSDFSEIYANVSFGIFTVGYNVLASGDGASFGDDSYIYGDAAFELAKELALTLHIGTGTDAFYAGESYVEYGASIAKGGFTFGVSANDLTDSNTKVYVSYSVDIDL